MRTLFSLVFLLALSGALIACGPSEGSDTLPDTGGGSDTGDGDTGDGDGSGTGSPTTTTTGSGSGTGTGSDTGGEFPTEQACDQMDIVFIIDNSGSMAEEQSNLSANFPRFIEVLDSFRTENGDPIDYRVAVTSTGRSKNWTEDVFGIPIPGSQSGDDGRFVQACNMPRRWIEKTDPDPAGQFACAARLGTTGPPEEMPLSSLKAALDDRMDDGTNSGFLREDGLLGVVILTDEDDCSREDNGFTLGAFELMCDKTEPVQTYKTFLDDLTGGAGRWALATIAGPGPGECRSDFGVAAEAVRLKNLVNLVGANGVFSSICEGDLAEALNDALMTFDTACRNLPRPD